MEKYKIIVDETISNFKYIEITEEGIKYHLKPFLYLFKTPINYSFLCEKDREYIINKCKVKIVKICIIDTRRPPKKYIKKYTYKVEDVKYIKLNYSKGLVYMYENHFKNLISLQSLRTFIWRLKNKGEL